MKFERFYGGTGHREKVDGQISISVGLPTIPRRPLRRGTGPLLLPHFSRRCQEAKKGFLSEQPIYLKSHLVILSH